MKKNVFVVSTLVAALLLSITGCSKGNEPTPPAENTVNKEIEMMNQKVEEENKLRTEMDAWFQKADKNTVLVELNGKKLTKGDLQKREPHTPPDQLPLRAIEFIDKVSVIEKYPVSYDDVNKELFRMKTKMEQEKNKGELPSEEDIQYKLAFNKAMIGDKKITENDLKKVYEKQFKETGITYKDAKPMLEEVAPQYLGKSPSEVIIEARKGMKPTYTNDSLEKAVKLNLEELEKNASKQ